MDNIKKLIIVAYCISVLFLVLIVPWKVVRQMENGFVANIYLGYSFLFSPRISYSVIDFGIVALELIALTVIAVLLYVISDKLPKLTSGKE